jgi:hypothetical protein
MWITKEPTVNYFNVLSITKSVFVNKVERIVKYNGEFEKCYIMYSFITLLGQANYATVQLG